VVGGVLSVSRGLDADALAWLGAAARTGVTLIGLCTGSFILCRAGLMAGRACCVHWLVAADFAGEFPGHPVVADRRFLDGGDRITCAGGGAVADLAAYLIERHLGRALASKSRHLMILDAPRRGPDAQPHPPLAAMIDDSRVRRALLLMEENVSSPLPLPSIAARLGVSTRQLSRLFEAELGQSPGEVYRGLRLRYASWLLANTDRTVTDIAIKAGFADGAHFSRCFKARNGSAPSIGRARSQADAVAAASHLVSRRVFD
jgi:transcriptional regulator GlxA family with amidase domain